MICTPNHMIRLEESEKQEVDKWKAAQAIFNDDCSCIASDVLPGLPEDRKTLIIGRHLATYA